MRLREKESDMAEELKTEAMDEDKKEEKPPMPQNWFRFNGLNREDAPAKHDAGTNCIKIGLPGKLILSKIKGLREVIFS